MMQVQSPYANQVTGPSTAQRPTEGVRTDPKSHEGKLWAQCTKFEGVFLAQMMKTMRETVPSQGGVLDASPGRKMFESSLDDHLTQRLAMRGTTGIAQQLYSGFLRHEKPASEAGSEGPRKTISD